MPILDGEAFANSFSLVGLMGDFVSIALKIEYDCSRDSNKHSEANMDQERHHIARQYLRVSASVQIEQALAISVPTIDLGMAGIALHAAALMATGAAVQLSFDVPIMGKLKKINVCGRITYCAAIKPGFKVGVHFESLDATAKAVIAAYLVD